MSNVITGYPCIMASVVVSSITGDNIKCLRDKILSIVSELKETSSKYLHTYECSTTA